MVHHTINPDSLAEAVSNKLTGDSKVYRHQEQCSVSETTTYTRLVMNKDLSKHVLVGVDTSVPTENDNGLPQRKFNQNIAFLRYAAEHNISPLCPVILAVGGPTDKVPYQWVAYADVNAWPLSSHWHQLKPQSRLRIVQELAMFTRKLAEEPPKQVLSHEHPLVDFIGSIAKRRILFPPFLLASAPDCIPDGRQLEKITTLAALVSDTACNRAARIAEAKGTATTAPNQITPVLPVVSAVLEQQCPTVLSHFNLTPENVWIDPISGTTKAILGWELAHFAPSWLATSPLSWLMDEKLDLILESEKKTDPWSVWRPHFSHPEGDTGTELRKLREEWETTLRSGDNSPFADTTREEDTQKRTAMRVLFVEEDQLHQSVAWAIATIYPSVPLTRQLPLLPVSFAGVAAVVAAYFDARLSVPLLTSVAAWLGWRFIFLKNPASPFPSSSKKITGLDQDFTVARFEALDSIQQKSQISKILSYSTQKKIPNEQTAVPCSPANSIAPSRIYVPSLLSKVPSALGLAP